MSILSGWACYLGDRMYIPSDSGCDPVLGLPCSAAWTAWVAWAKPCQGSPYWCCGGSEGMVMQCQGRSSGPCTQRTRGPYPWLSPQFCPVIFKLRVSLALPKELLISKHAASALFSPQEGTSLPTKEAEDVLPITVHHQLASDSDMLPYELGSFLCSHQSFRLYFLSI